MFFSLFLGEKGKEKAEKFFQDNLPKRENDLVEMYEGIESNGEVQLFCENREEK